MNSKISSWVRYIRKKLGLTHAELSKLSGLGQPTLSKIEKSEERGTVQLSTLKKIAEAMDCKLVYYIVPEGFESIEEYDKHKALQKAHKNLKEEAKKLKFELKTEEQKEAFLKILHQRYIDEMSAE